MAQTRSPLQPEPLLGEYEAVSPPTWEPLLLQVGDYLVKWFKYMGAVRLADGTRLHMYKHTWTRRYLHLSDDGRCFRYSGEGSYVRQRSDATMLAVFEGWWEIRLDAEERETHDHALRAAVYRACRREDGLEDICAQSDVRC